MNVRSRFSLALALVFVSGTASALAGGPPAFPVTVINPPGSPVPVTIEGTGVVVGNVAVTNTPSVNVANEVAARIVAMPGPAPYRADRHLTLPDFITSVQGPYVDVPDGARVVIEYVSFSCTTRPGDSMLNVGIGVAGVAPDGTAGSMF